MTTQEKLRRWKMLAVKRAELLTAELRHSRGLSSQLKKTYDELKSLESQVRIKDDDLAKLRCQLAKQGITPSA